MTHPETSKHFRIALPGSALQVALLLLSVLLVYRFFDAIARVLLILYAAAIVAIVVNSLARRLPVDRRGVAAFVGITIVSAVIATVWFGGPVIMHQVRDMAAKGPEFAQQLASVTQWLRDATGLQIAPLDETVGRWFKSAAGNGDVIGRATGIFTAMLLVLLVFFGGLFAVARPNDRLLTPMMRAVPRQHRGTVERILKLLGERVGTWIRGQLIAMSAVGILTMIALLIIGVPNALLLGVLNGLFEFIPLLGPWLGAVPVVAVAALEDPNKGLWAAGAMFGIQMAEANIITPFAMSKAANVHPFVTLFALFFFSSIFGYLGLLLALPLVLLCWTLIEVIWVERVLDTDHDRIKPVVDE